MVGRLAQSAAGQHRCAAAATRKPRRGRRNDRKAVLLAGNTFGDSRSDGDFEEFVLIGLEHQKNPQNEREYPNQSHDRGPKPDAEKAARRQDNTQADAQNGESAEDHDGLRSVEFHEGPLINQKENNSRDPAKNVAQKTGNVFCQAVA